MNRQHLFFFSEMCTQEVQQLQLVTHDIEHRESDETNKETQSFTIPNPRSAGNVPTVNIPSSVEKACPQNFTVGQPKNHISDLQFEKFSALATFQCWKTSF